MTGIPEIRKTNSVKRPNLLYLARPLIGNDNSLCRWNGGRTIDTSLRARAENVKLFFSRAQRLKSLLGRVLIVLPKLVVIN